MAKRHRITKERLLDQYGDVVLTSKDGGAMLHVAGLPFDPEIVVAGDYNLSRSNSKSVLAGSVRNLVDNGILESVYVSFPCGTLGADHVTFCWTSLDSHAWDGTFSEEL